MLANKTTISIFLNVVLIGVICLYTNQTIAQINFTQATYDINEQCGLNSTEAYHILKDSKENLWISTDMGLVKYDGFNSITFSTKNGLSSNVIFKAYEDPFGRIWALSIRNELYYIKNDSVHAFAYNSLLNKLISSDDNLLKKLIVTPDSTIHFSVGVHGSFSIDTRGKLVKRHENSHEFEIQVIDKEFLLTGKVASSELSTAQNLKRFKVNAPLFYEKKALPKLNSSRPSDLSELVVKNNTLEGLALIAGYIISFPSNQILDSNVTAFEKIPNTNYFWIGKSNKTFRVEFEDNKLVEIKNSCILRNTFITSIHADIGGNTWFTSLEKGVVFLPQYKVHHLTDELGNKIEKEVVNFVVNKDKLVLSYKNSIVDYSNYKSYKSNHSLLEFNENQLIVSNLSNKQWKNEISQDFDLLTTRHARDFYLTDSVIYSSAASIDKYHLSSRKSESIHYNPKKSRFLSQLCIYQDTLFVTSKNQLYKLVGGELKDVYHFGFKEITDMIQYKNMLLISTKNYGIYKYENGELSEFLNLSNGLFNEQVNTLTLSQNNRYLYIGCFKGLEIYDLLTNNCINISLNQGFTNLKVNQIREFDNQIYFATAKGFYRLSNKDLHNLNTINTKSDLNPIVTNLRVDGENYDNFISLPSDAKILNLSFQIRDLNNWFNKKYQYQINMGEWVTIYSPEIVLINPRKKLNINLRYFMSNNAWSESTPLIKGKVREPFYKSILFYIFLFSAIGLILFTYLRSRSNRKIKKLELENQMLSYQQRMQNARMKPHFIFNVLNSIYSFILFNENKRAANYLLKFSTLMRGVLENSREEKVKIADEVELLENYLELEKLRNEDSFNYSIVLGDLDKFRTIPSLMIQPFVENAIVHGVDHNNKNSQLTIDINKKDEKTVEVKVFNTGVHTDDIKSKLMQSTDKNAVGITRSRLNNYNSLEHLETYKIDVNQKNEGTLITLYLPLF